MKKFKCLLTAMLLGCSTMSFAQFMNGGGSSSSSSDNTPWKGLRFSYDRTFVNIDIDDAPSQDMNGFSLGYVYHNVRFNYPSQRCLQNQYQR